MKKTPFIIAGVFIFLILFCFVGVFVFFRINASPYAATENEKIEISVPSGTSIKNLAEQLEQNKIIKNADVFYLAARFTPVRLLLVGTEKPLSLKSGIYEVSGSMTYGELFEIFSKGGRDEYIKLMIPEGFTLSMIAHELENQNVCSFADFMDKASSRELLESYNIKSTSFEGYLFPDTYFLIENMEAETVLQTMVANFFSHIKEIDGLAELSGEKLNDVVKLASIVEREYQNADEAPLIASVFKNRIRDGIGLYSCATIVYIITEILGKPHPDVVTYADLEIESPFNTYKWKGLPPTPISNPGMVALVAAANPPKTDYYYFRVVDPENGRHAFSKDFDTHINEGNLYTKRVR